MDRIRLINNHLSTPEVCIVAVGRSPILRSFDLFSTIEESDLAAQTLQGTLKNFSISPSHVQEFYLGKVFSSNVGQALPKQILALAGFPESASSMSVNKLCASGMKATELAYLSILSGQADCVVAGGLEIMSRPPFLLSLRNGIGNKVKDSFDLDGFPDAVTKETPIVIADKFCRDFGYSREELDEYARFSIEKAHKAKKELKFTEVVEISLPKSQKVKNDYFRPLSAVDNSKPVHKNGFNTPGNSCGLSDGASFLVLSSRSKAIREGWKVLASILSFSDAEQHASLFPSTPTLATEKALKKAGILINQIDFMEINEPFACVVLHNSKMLKFPLNKINIYGGAISMGHPVGSSGCRIIGTLTSILKKEGGTFGVASICNAGGGGSAVVLKRE